MQSTYYNDKGRLANFVESPEQQRIRLEFLNKREWARRISDWVHQSNTEDESLFNSSQSSSLKYQFVSRTPAPADIAFLQSKRYPDADTEPYIFYSSDSSWSPPSPPHSPSSSGSSSPSTDRTPLPVGAPRSRQRRISHKRQQSLSIIPEEDALVQA